MCLAAFDLQEAGVQCSVIAPTPRPVPPPARHRAAGRAARSTPRWGVRSMFGMGRVFGPKSCRRTAFPFPLPGRRPGPLHGDTTNAVANTPREECAAASEPGTRSEWLLHGHGP